MKARKLPAFKKQPSPTDIRRAVTLLKKYQVIEPLELLDDLNGNSRLIVYPCINVVLLGDDVRETAGIIQGGRGPAGRDAAAGD